MKVNELNTLIESVLTSEVKRKIMEQSQQEGKTVYHIMCDGEPVDTFDSEKEAKEHVDKLKQDHPGKQFIIEKAQYESHDDMLDKLDEMGEQLENESENMKHSEAKEGNAFSGALAKAKAEHKKEFNVGGKEFNVKEDSEFDEGNAFSGALANAKKHDEKTFHVDGKEYDVEEDWNPNESLGTDGGGSSVYEDKECHECGDGYMEEEAPMHEHGICECGGMINEEGICDECGMSAMEEEAPMHEHGICECGGMINEEGICDECGSMYENKKEVCPKCGKEICECGMYESKKKKVRLKESELINMIKDMVNEAMKGEPGVPGVPGMYITNKAQKGSKKENQDALAAVDKKMKDYLNFDGNDHSEFPHQNGMKTKKAAYANSKEQDEETAKNFAGLENLDYDLVDEKFKDRMKKAIEGHSTMGNAPITEKPTIDPSNGADKGKEAEEKEGNHIQTPETAKKINKQVKDRQKDKDERELYRKQAVPVSSKKDTVNESVSFKTILSEEVEKMKKLYSYNKKTQ